MIQGERLTRPTKTVLSADIAAALGIQAPAVSEGASVDSAFLDAIFRAQFGTPSGGTDTYRKTERLLTRLGLTYDPYWDTSESSPTGGGTVTARAFSRIRSAVTGNPRRFIVSVPTADLVRQAIAFDGGAAGQRNFNDAGPGSLVIFYDREMEAFVGSAQVEYIDAGWSPPWRADFIGYIEFDWPVPASDLQLPGWRPTDLFTEISTRTYDALLTEGDDPNAGEIVHQAWGRERRTPDAGGDVVATRVRRDFPTDVVAPTIQVPDALPGGVIDAAPVRVPEYRADGESDAVRGGPSMPKRSEADRRRDREAELRAVELATAALESDGWTLDRDCQADGVGYDLRFVKAGRTLKVEIKGIQGEGLAFNLTPKELWRAENDSEWVLIAVTRVLSPQPLVNLILRDRVVGAARQITGYRVTL